MNEPIMLEKFPTLSPSKDFKSWKGFILLNMYDSVYIEISCPNIPQLDNLEVHIPEFKELKFDQFNLKKTVETIKKETNSLPEFLKEFILVLSKILKQDLFSNVQNLCNMQTGEKLYSIIQEVNIFSKYVQTIDEELNHIIFNVLDTCRHNHLLKIYIPKDYPIYKKQFLNFESMIPSATMNYLTKVNTISKLFEEFKTLIDKLSNFWEVQKEVINTCNVIGSYTFKDVNYKIPIDNQVCIEIEIDPFNPKTCPKFNLCGQPESIKKFQQRLNDIDPYKEDNTHEVEVSDSNYCFICYDQLDIVPKEQTKTCTYEKCDALYHMTCICEWLLNSGSTPMFEHLQGKCPQCEEDMLVALENFDLIKT
ncbi:uncharacterized protein LOC112692953 isoform X2 [Sipha flava]|uniref:Uncharacterized protein LOC112692953 isoform X2 n=1 Tax=Sipha flava TaxID=143950 RepID=A0A8B8GK05_9HEMI|nr:uncharacterized protein LOC112692953 isoform X2 [Sipha flava]